MNNLKLMVDILDNKQAEDIRVIDIKRISTVADFFVIANSKNLQHQCIGRRCVFWNWQKKVILKKD